MIDAVFGAGLARDVDGVVADTLRAARRVVAVDVPSGLDGGTGAVRGYAPQAALTVTFFRLKPGTSLLPGRELCGDTVLADIGIAGCRAVAAWRRTPSPTCPKLWHLPPPEPQSHKYSRGHVTVVGGDDDDRSVTIGGRRCTPRRCRARHHRSDGRRGTSTAAGSPGLLVSGAPLAELLQDAAAQRVGVRPGLGPEAARNTLPILLSAGRSVVGDADVFTAFAGTPDALRGAAVLTPHAGEFTRSFGNPGHDRVAAVRAAAARTGAVVLLKGADTIVASPDGRVAINASAPPWLATAGSGDVLAGLIAGLLAQGMTPWEAAAAGAFVHGRAGMIAGQGLVVEDLLPALTPALVEAAAQPHLFRGCR